MVMLSTMVTMATILNITMPNLTMLALTMDITTLPTKQDLTTVMHHDLNITAIHAQQPTEHQSESPMAHLLTEEVLAQYTTDHSHTDQHLMVAARDTEEDHHMVTAADLDDHTEHAKVSSSATTTGPNANRDLGKCRCNA